MSTLHARVRPSVGPARGLVLLMHGVGSNERSLLSVAQALDPSPGASCRRSRRMCRPISPRAACRG